MNYECNLTFHSTDKELEKGFQWAKEQALSYAHHGGDAVGLWYEAALPNRQAFCMRDVSHQSYGAAVLGLEEHTYQMLYRFAENISKEKDYCTFWEITKDNLPCKDDYENDQDFWYNFPGSFEVIRACYEQYLWTGNKEYIENDVFLNYYLDTCTKLVERWDLDGDGLPEHYAEYGRRGLASYNETDVAIMTAGDMLASQYTAYVSLAKMLTAAGRQEEVKGYEARAKNLKKAYLECWYNAEQKGFYGAIKADGSFYEDYYKEGNFLPLFFGILDGENTCADAVRQLKEHGVDNVEGMSYLPQIYYEHGEEKLGYEVLKKLCDETLARREYPEISYSVIGTIANQIMGIKAQEEQIVTCSRLESTEKASILHVSIWKGTIDVSHEGNFSSRLTNNTGETILWKAAFTGEVREAFVNGERRMCRQEKDAAGQWISFVQVQVLSGEEVQVQAVRDNCDIQIEVENGLYETMTVTRAALGEGRFIHQFSFSHLNSKQDAAISLWWKVPLYGIAGQWHPLCGFDRGLKADWAEGTPTMTAVSAPVYSFFDTNGRSLSTFALSEVKKAVTINAGVHEEDGTILVRIVIQKEELLTEEAFSLSVYMDNRENTLQEALEGVSRWWEESLHIKPMQAPAFAREPMYSTWYSYHQDINEERLEAEAVRAKALGFTTMIVDDGWQTADQSRGYAYCGEWKPDKDKFPDMAAHVARIHEIGLKYMLWFSVPFVGRKAKVYAEFSDKIIYYDNSREAAVLDIRYPQVRNYLIARYEEAAAIWKVDGLKLDFIDEFYFRSESLPVKADMDCGCLQEALGRLLSEAVRNLKEVNKDIMIEFRQRYIGPEIRKYGNILRVTDCPASGIHNRVGSMDLRMLGGCTPIHSDMIMWNEQEAVEDAAIQLQNALFATPQISVLLKRQSEAHREMIAYQIAFLRKHQTLLQCKKLLPEDPQHLYPVIHASDDTQEIIAVYAQNQLVKPDRSKECVTIIMAVRGNGILVRQRTDKAAELTTLNCRGQQLKKWQEPAGLEYLQIPMESGGSVTIQYQ